MFVEQANLVIWSFSCEEQKTAVRASQSQVAERYTVH